MFKELAEQGRKFIETKYELFLPKAKCHSVGQMTKYEGWMNNLRKDLEKRLTEKSDKDDDTLPIEEKLKKLGAKIYMN